MTEKVVEKFALYDLLGIVIPGFLIVSLTIIAFPDIAKPLTKASFPSGFSLLGLLALAVFVGQLVQALASLVEPLLNHTWGGRPSERALKEGLGERYLPADAATRIHTKLVDRASDQDASGRGLFLLAARLGAGAAANRIERFNGLYAYHRGLCLLIIVALAIVVASFYWGAGTTLSPLGKATLIGTCVAVGALLWYRTKQRAFYYVREVLHCAEQVIDKEAADAAAAGKRGE